MADPATILGLISASLTITIRAATIGKDIHSLRQKFKTTNAAVAQLSVHVSAIRVAARSLSSWLEDETIGSDEVEEVRYELLAVLSACGDLLSDLQDHLAKALAGAEAVNFRGASRYIWDEDLIKETANTLHHQETAVILILQTLGQLTQLERRKRIQGPEMVQTLTKAKRPSSSIFGICGDNRSSARFSYERESLANIDVCFNFDTEVVASSAYRKAFSSLLRRNVPEPALPPLQPNRAINSSQSAVVNIRYWESASPLESLVDEVEAEIVETRHSDCRQPFSTKRREQSDLLPTQHPSLIADYRDQKPVSDIKTLLHVAPVALPSKTPPRLHRCNKGERCKKWREQQRDIQHQNLHPHRNGDT
jgi:hypothetical protein